MTHLSKLIVPQDQMMIVQGRRAYCVMLHNKFFSNYYFTGSRSNKSINAYLKNGTSHHL